MSQSVLSRAAEVAVETITETLHKQWKESIVEMPWDERAYYQEQYPKDQLFLHHTDGRTSAAASARYLEGSSIKTRVSGDSRGQHYSVGVPWWVDRDGTTIRTFDDRCWAHHNGTGRRGARRSIAIELENLGFINERGGNFYNRYGEEIAEEQYPIHEHPEPWRGSRFYEAYTDAQVDSLILLIDDILRRHPGIPRRIPQNFFPEVPLTRTQLARFKGILAHTFTVGYIPKRYAKYDVSIALRPHMDRICRALKLQRVRI
ncbi:MAG TPA: hypothetical protein DEA96_12430 [Leptospiraceae bacterium]|mgnify:FL=1|nr:hypothetical protein [Spirochaetaceae bacterium]MBU43345.1 hypothetical protein [Spirochaetaceae bacterium]HBS05768.1 hypothetical protein [Leptospiraceae bacterium]|tara:strand:- start:11312 stop:12091 length:780 start_codon:yes stop_codon:yes gene_type:complete